MVVVSRSIQIQAPVARVFALMADPAAKAALNPLVEPIRVEIEDHGPLRLGSICRYRLQAGNRIIDYRGRVTAFAPERLIQSVTDSAVPFEIQVETAPADDGTVLTQTERFEATDTMRERALPPSLWERVTEFGHRVFVLTDLDTELRLRERQEQALADDLGDKLEQWLVAIKRHLETPAPE